VWVFSSFLSPLCHSLVIIPDEKVGREVLAERIQRLVIETGIADDPLNPKIDFVVVGHDGVGQQDCGLGGDGWLAGWMVGEADDDTRLQGRTECGWFFTRYAM